MYVQSVISLNYLYNSKLRNVEGDISNSTENINQQSKENRAIDIDSSVANSSVSKNETENHSASLFIDETEKYPKLNKIMYILEINVFLLIEHAYLSLILAAIYAYNGYSLFFMATYGPLLVSNLFVVIISCLWKYSKEKNKMLINILRLALFLICAEVPIYYHDCHRLHQLTLRHQSRSYYRQTIQHIDDMRYLLCIVTVLQVVPQAAIQALLIRQYDTETRFVQSLHIIMTIFTALCFITAIVTYFYCNYDKEFGKKYRVIIVVIPRICFSVCTYLFDVMSDFILAGTYFYSQQWLYGCLTLTFVTAPGFYITWLRHYRDEKEIHLNPLILVKILFNLDPVSSYWKSIKLIAKIKRCQVNESLDSGCSEDRKKYYAALVKNNHTIAVLRYNESYTESIMQLILQIAILLRNDHAGIPITTILSIASSLKSLAIGTVVLCRTKRIQDYIYNEGLKEYDPLNWTEAYIQFLGYLFIIIPKVLVISIAVSTFPVITTCLLIGNYTVFFLFISCQFETTPLPYKIGQCAIHAITPPINTLTIEMSFHVLYFLQIVLLMIFCTRAYLPDIIHFVVLISSNVLGIVLIFWYRTCYENVLETNREQ